MQPPELSGGDREDGQGTFHTTHWSVILAARNQDDGTVAREALASLCSTYWYPLYAFIRRNGFAPHDAEDLTQEFFYNFLRRDSLTNVNPVAGKFRSYLLACLKHFLSNQRRDRQTQRRGGGIQVVSLDGDAADSRYLIEAADHLTPDLLFEQRWALTVLDQAMKELQREYVQRASSDMFEDLRGFLVSGKGTVPRPELAKKYGITPGAIDVAIHRLRHRFGVLLREQILRTVSSPNEVEEELRYLISIIDI